MDGATGALEHERMQPVLKLPDRDLLRTEQSLQSDELQETAEKQSERLQAEAEAVRLQHVEELVEESTKVQHEMKVSIQAELTLMRNEQAELAATRSELDSTRMKHARELAAVKEQCIKQMQSSALHYTRENAELKDRLQVSSDELLASRRTAESLERRLEEERTVARMARHASDQELLVLTKVGAAEWQQFEAEQRSLADALALRIAEQRSTALHVLQLQRKLEAAERMNWTYRATMPSAHADASMMPYSRIESSIMSIQSMAPAADGAGEEEGETRSSAKEAPAPAPLAQRRASGLSRRLSVPMRKKPRSSARDDEEWQPRRALR